MAAPPYPASQHTCGLCGALWLSQWICTPPTKQRVNSLAPGKFEWNLRFVIFKRILVIDGWGISWEIALIWMSMDFIDDQSTLFQVMALCRQARSHYLSQCWPRSLSPYGVTWPQWVKRSHYNVLWDPVVTKPIFAAILTVHIMGGINSLAPGTLCGIRRGYSVLPLPKWRSLESRLGTFLWISSK